MANGLTLSLVYSIFTGKPSLRSMFLHCVVAEYGIFAAALFGSYDILACPRFSRLSGKRRGDRRNGSAKNGGVSRFPDDHDYRLLFTRSPLALIDERVWNW